LKLGVAFFFTLLVDRFITYTNKIGSSATRALERVHTNADAVMSTTSLDLVTRLNLPKSIPYARELRKAVHLQLVIYFTE